ncbi:MAG: UDP-N-acetylmuramoyl-L-alanyl-D-glutamate--2,6-diaminopimelate ligase [Pseudomonadota bacterium]
MQALHTPSHAAQWLRQQVTGTLQSDSRKLQPGDGFIAWPGAAVDARQFVGDALKTGAAACLVEQTDVASWGLDGERVASYPGLKTDTGVIAAEFFGAPSEALQVVAVTGTNGKTSTAWWLAQALSALPDGLALPCGMVGTLGVGRPPASGAAHATPAHASVISTGLTTPDPVLLQRTLRRFSDEGLTACAMEASSIGIEEHRLDGTRIRVAVFTNFTQDHLDYHGSMEAYWQSKRRLFAWPGLQAAVINVDDVQGQALADSLRTSALDVWTISSQCEARLQARAIAYGSLGLSFDVVEGGASCRLQTRTIGSYNVSNLLGVLGAMRALGVSLQDAVHACSTLHPVPGRMECLGGVDAPLVAVDYAHTPDALSQALAALRPLAQQRGGRLWCVFGCGGDRDASKRPLMGAIASQKADQVVVTSDNPRGEKPESIIAHILLGLSQSKAVDVQPDRAQAIAEAITRAAPSDVVLLAGKGHEDTQEIAGTKHPFSDRTHAQQALNRRPSASLEARA